MIDKTVFFPGKFHPPHLGHARTVLDLIFKYRKVIVGVSGDIPGNPVTDVDNIFNILKDLFYNFDNVTVIKIKGTLVEKLDTAGLPEFDLLLSGNQKVIDWSKNIGIAAEFLNRSEGYYFSGTEIRDELLHS